MTASSPWLTIHCRLMLIPAGSLLERHARPVLRLLRFVYLSICQNVTYNIHSKFHNATGCYRHDREADVPHLLIIYICPLTITLPPNVCLSSLLLRRRYGWRSIAMSVSVCPRAYFRKYMSDFNNLVCLLPMAVARSSSGGVAICYVLLLL